MGGCADGHEVSRDAAEKALRSVMNRTLGEIDRTGVLASPRINKGVAGAIVEQSVFGYPADSARRPDLIVDGTPTELKTTGVVRKKRGGKTVLDAKEPMSITAVQPETIASEEFDRSALLEKCEHLLIVYYEYLHRCACTADYADFPVKGYDFHELSDAERRAIERDWTVVRDFIADAQESCEVPEDRYPLLSSELNRYRLSVLDTSPKWPNRPRFRFKRAFVGTLVERYFGDRLEVIPDEIGAIGELDARCAEARRLYGGRALGEAAATLGVAGAPTKQLAEKVCVRMLGGAGGKTGGIECLQRLSVSAHSIVLTPSGRRTEDFKINQQVDFDEICDRTVSFEESQFRASFADDQILVMVWREQEGHAGSLERSVFMGFKRLVFPDAFIDGPVRTCWDRMRSLVQTGTLRDVVSLKSDGSPRIGRSGVAVSAPNWPKASEGDVFLRGTGRDARDKTVTVNGIRMYRQNPWVRGTWMVGALEEIGYL